MSDRPPPPPPLHHTPHPFAEYSDVIAQALAANSGVKASTTTPVYLFPFASDYDVSEGRVTALTPSFPSADGNKSQQKRTFEFVAPTV